MISCLLHWATTGRMSRLRSLNMECILLCQIFWMCEYSNHSLEALVMMLISRLTSHQHKYGNIWIAIKLSKMLAKYQVFRLIWWKKCHCKLRLFLLINGLGNAKTVNVASVTVSGRVCTHPRAVSLRGKWYVMTGPPPTCTVLSSVSPLATVFLPPSHGHSTYSHFRHWGLECGSKNIDYDRRTERLNWQDGKLGVLARNRVDVTFIGNGILSLSQILFPSLHRVSLKGLSIFTSVQHNLRYGEGAVLAFCGTFCE